MFNVALKGALSEIRHLEFLKERGVSIKKYISDENAGKPDFIVQDLSGRVFLMEHKRVSNKLYADGSLRLEIQKTRNSGDCKSNLLYDIGHFDFVSIDVSEHTGKNNDYRYVRTKDLLCDNRFPNKIKAIQKEDKQTWREDLGELIKL